MQLNVLNDLAKAKALDGKNQNKMWNLRHTKILFVKVLVRGCTVHRTTLFPAAPQFGHKSFAPSAGFSSSSWDLASQVSPGDRETYGAFEAFFG